MTGRLARIASILMFAALSLGAATARAQFADVEGQTAAPADAATEETTATTLSADELRALVAPVALYPDALLAIVLPAATNPLQVVEASRFLEQQKADPNLQPDENWDPAVIALLNYPQVIKQMNDDLGWTQDLGNAVMDQQEDVLNAIQTARSEASEAGYLQSNDQQNVTVTDNDNITIESAQPDTVYVPTYDPQTVVTNNYTSYPPPVYSEPYPYYYAPGAAFFTGAIVGATFAYAFDWDNDDIDIDCCDSGDINIDRNTNIERGDINIGSGNTNIDKSKIQNRFNGDHAKAGANSGKMKWSPQKARQKSTAARKPAGAKPTAANISQQLKNPKPAAARVQNGKVAQKQGQRGQSSINAANKKNPSFKQQSLKKQQQVKQRPNQQRQQQVKKPQQRQLKQKQGGAFSQQMVPQQRVKQQSNRGQRSMSGGGSRPRPNRR
ncbi:MAG TPA: DUF3300 domain-containing protein [Dongiaceae bacterium]|nr:DUF3300 domain-containing protein [Dongiaceae bacterium]